MIKLLLLLLIIIQGCSIDTKTGLWDKRKETEKNSKEQELFSSENKEVGEFNPFVKIKLNETFINKVFHNNVTNNIGMQNYDGLFHGKSKFKFSKIKSFSPLNDNLITTKNNNLIIFDGEGSIIKLDQNLNKIWKKNFYSKKEKNKLISIGRLTYQKNFELMIKGFSRIKKYYPDYRLTIVGSGEKKHELKKLLDNLSISNQIMIKPFSPNIYDFYLKSEIFISTALWEDPGFTILEAAMFNLTILTSNCPNGPREFLNENKRGHGFINGNSDDFEKNLKHILSNDFNYEDNFKKKTLAKKYCRRFTIFNHFTKFEKILN